MVDTRNDNEEPEIINDKQRIITIIKRLCRSHAVISMTLPDTKSVIQCLVQEFNPDDEHLVLEDISNNESPVDIAGTPDLAIKTDIDGANVNFSSELVDVKSTTLRRFYHIELPDEISYLQRRISHRVTLDESDHIPTHITTSSKIRLEGMLEDISTGGIGVVFPSHLPESIKPDSSAQCGFTIPGENEIKCVVTIRAIFHKNTYRPARIGAQFVNISRLDQKIIERYVISLERKKIKRT